MTPKYVIAGNYSQAEEWAWVKRIQKTQLRYVRNFEMLHGIPRGTQIILTGTYYERDDINELRHFCITRGLILVEEEDDESNYTTSGPIRNISRRIRYEES